MTAFHIRDDFTGAAAADLTGRAPETGGGGSEVWTELNTPVGYFQMPGDGTAVAVGASFAARAMLPLPACTALTITINATGGSDTPAFNSISVGVFSDTDSSGLSSIGPSGPFAAQSLVFTPGIDLGTNAYVLIVGHGNAAGTDSPPGHILNYVDITGTYAAAGAFWTELVSATEVP